MEELKKTDNLDPKTKTDQKLDGETVPNSDKITNPINTANQDPQDLQDDTDLKPLSSNYLAVKIGILSGAVFSLGIGALILFFYHQPGVLEGKPIQCVEQHTSANESAALQQQKQTKKICPTGQYYVSNGPDFENGCQDIHAFNLLPGNGQCNIIKQIYQSPENYNLNDETKQSLEGWNKTCSAPVAPVCGLNQVADTSGQCTCKENYKPQGDENKSGSKICLFDCGNVVKQIQSLQQSDAANGSPVTKDQLQKLLADARANKCSVPEISENQKKCAQYQSDADLAVKEARFVDYFKSSKNYIEANCSGTSNNQCQKILAEANVANDGINQTKDSVQKSVLRAERSKLRNQYYSNPACNNVARRCAEIKSASVKTSNATQQTSATSTGANLTPTQIFNDDQNYNQTYCGCKDLLAKYADVNIATADIPDSEKSKLQTCIQIKETLKQL